MTKRRFSMLLVLAATLVLSFSSAAVHASEEVMLAYDAVSKAFGFGKFTVSDATTENDVLEHAQR